MKKTYNEKKIILIPWRPGGARGAACGGGGGCWTGVGVAQMSAGICGELE